LRIFINLSKIKLLSPSLTLQNPIPNYALREAKSPKRVTKTNIPHQDEAKNNEK